MSSIQSYFWSLSISELKGVKKLDDGVGVFGTSIKEGHCADDIAYNDVELAIEEEEVRGYPVHR